MNLYMPLVPSNLRPPPCKAYDLLRIKLEEHCCPQTATYVEKLAELEGTLVQNNIVPEADRLCAHPALLYTIVNECKSAENVCYLGRSLELCKHLINVINLVREANLNRMFKWLLTELYDIVSNYIGDLDCYKNSSLELQEIVVAFYVNFCLFLLQDAKRLYFVIEVLEKALTLSKHRPWIPELNLLSIKFNRMELVVKYMLAEAHELVAKQILRENPENGAKMAQKSRRPHTSGAEKENVVLICNSIITKARNYIIVQKFGSALMELDKAQYLITKNRQIKTALIFLEMQTFRYKGICFYNTECFSHALDYLQASFSICQNQCYDAETEAQLLLILGATNARLGDLEQAKVQLGKAESLLVNIGEFSDAYKARLILETIAEREKIEQLQQLIAPCEANGPQQNHSNVENLSSTSSEHNDPSPIHPQGYASATTPGISSQQQHQQFQGYVSAMQATQSYSKLEQRTELQSFSQTSVHNRIFNTCTTKSMPSVFQQKTPMPQIQTQAQASTCFQAHNASAAQSLACLGQGTQSLPQFRAIHRSRKESITVSRSMSGVDNQVISEFQRTNYYSQDAYLAGAFSGSSFNALMSNAPFTQMLGPPSSAEFYAQCEEGYNQPSSSSTSGRKQNDHDINAGNKHRKQ